MLRCARTGTPARQGCRQIPTLALGVLLIFVSGSGVFFQPVSNPARALGPSFEEPTIHVGSYPIGVAFDPVNNLLYVSNFGSNNISVINTSNDRVVAWIPTAYGVGPLAVDTATGVVYFGDAVLTVYGIDPFTNRIEWSIPLASAGCPSGCAPEPQTYDTSNGDIYITDLSIDRVSVVHGSVAVGSIPVGTGPNGAAYDSANGDIYVSNEGASVPSINLTVIDGSSNLVVGQVAGSGGGPGVAYDSMNGEIFVCENGIQDGFSNVVTVVNGTSNQLVASIPISTSCQAALYDPVDNYVYITDRAAPGGRDQSNVTLVDPTTNRIVLALPTQLGPTGIAYDSSNHDVYVADSDTSNISILPQIFRLTVHETGLPSGTNWSATVGGTTVSSTASTITFPEVNGTFGYSIGRVANQEPTPSSGSLTISNGPKELNVTFSKGGGGGLLGLPGNTAYYVLVGIGAIAAILIAVFVVLARRKRRAKPPSGVSPGRAP